MVPVSRPLFLTLLVLGAFLIRLAAVAALRPIASAPGISANGTDGVEFNALAIEVAGGHGYVGPTGQPTSFRAPGFPFLLAGLYSLIGVRYLAAYLLFCLLGALTCWLTYWLARELLPEAGARLAAVLAMVYLPHVYFSTLFLSENLFAPCLALGLWLFIRYLRTGSSASLCLSGLILGWAALTRPFAILMFPILLGVLIWHQGTQRQRRFVPALVLAASFLVVILPWTIRNYHVFGRFVLVANNGGSTFYGGNNSRVVSEFRYLGGWVSTVELPGRNLIDATPDQVSHDQMEWRLGVQWVRQHAAFVPLLCVYKFVRLWLPEVDSPNRKFDLLQIVFYTPFLALMVLGGFHCWRNQRCRAAPWLALHAAVLSTVLMALVFWGSPRFRDANTPVMMIYAAIGAQALFGARRTLKNQPVAVT